MVQVGYDRHCKSIQLNNWALPFDRIRLRLCLCHGIHRVVASSKPRALAATEASLRESARARCREMREIRKRKGIDSNKFTNISTEIKQDDETPPFPTYCTFKKKRWFSDQNSLPSVRRSMRSQANDMAQQCMQRPLLEPWCHKQIELPGPMSVDVARDKWNAEFIGSTQYYIV